MNFAFAVSPDATKIVSRFESCILYDCVRHRLFDHALTHLQALEDEDARIQLNYDAGQNWKAIHVLCLYGENTSVCVSLLRLMLAKDSSLLSSTTR